ncbi:MAG: HAD family hydrolase [Anaerolineales bacterium]|jgi:HAD superfamily hydrolase (TIGR01549 family)/HAD superfamily hydrolase (TIGR01509 family)|nr:HAD family hydrolase [Anaerolineales bacterium]
MTIRAVFFDMGGTIQTFGYSRELRLAATPGLQNLLVSAGINLPVDLEQLFTLVTTGLARYHQWNIHSLQELPPHQVWKEYILTGYPLDPKILESIAEELMVYVETHYYHRQMRPEIPQVLQALQDMGLKIGLISNVCSHGQVPRNLAEYGIAHFFNPVVLSSEYGWRKPDPAIFHYAARLANVPTSECLYVGDRVARDILGARKAGFRLAVQILHDYDHGEVDEGANPDAVITEMSSLIDILKQDQMDSRQVSPANPPGTCHVRALLFDAGDILYYRPKRGTKFTKFLTELGLDASACHTGEREKLVQMAYRGQINQDQYRQAILSLYGVCEPEQVERGKQILAEEDNGVLFFDGVRQTLLALKRQGYLLGIVTDTANPIHVKLGWFEQGGFEHVWDSIISSQEIGVRKPDPAIYRAAMQQLGVTSDQAAFVGHKPSELDGAHAVGIKTIAFNYEENAQADYYIQQFSELLKLPILA